MHFYKHKNFQVVHNIAAVAINEDFYGENQRLTFAAEMEHFGLCDPKTAAEIFIYTLNLIRNSSK